MKRKYKKEINNLIREIIIIISIVLIRVNIVTQCQCHNMYVKWSISNFARVYIFVQKLVLEIFLLTYLYLPNCLYSLSHVYVMNRIELVSIFNVVS